MPELPEVEIIRQSLDKKIKQKKVKKVIIRNRNLRFKIPLNFSSYLKNKKIIKVGRFSKYLIIYLSEDSYCLIHLGMSGTIHIIGNKMINKFTNTSFYNSPFLPKKHNHIEIIFDNFKIVYNDPRRFGYIDLTNKEPKTHKFLSSLGPEPLSNYFNADNLAKTLLNKNKSIKNALLDQNIVSGLGNIYVCEAIFRSKINPKKNCSKLVTSKGKPRKNLILLVQKINEVIKEAIEAGGSSLRDFSNTSGKMGYFQSSFNVYNRENEKCLLGSCNGVVKRIIQSGRSTFFCSKCQK